MKFKFTFLEKEIIGIGAYRIQFETNIRMEEHPNFARIKEVLEDKILLELGTTKEAAEKDKAYSMDFIVKKKPQLGLSMPGDNYTLVITEGGCIKRITKGFTIQEDV